MRNDGLLVWFIPINLKVNRLLSNRFWSVVYSEAIPLTIEHTCVIVVVVVVGISHSF